MTRGEQGSDSEEVTEGTARHRADTEKLVFEEVQQPVSCAEQAVTASEQSTFQSQPTLFRADISHYVVDFVQQSEQSAFESNSARTKEFQDHVAKTLGNVGR